MNCPFYDAIENNRRDNKHTKSKIYCKRGQAKTQFKGDAVIHQDKYCNGTYTKCVCYDILENEWRTKE